MPFIILKVTKVDQQAPQLNFAAFEILVVNWAVIF